MRFETDTQKYRLNPVADALLAFQYRDTEEDGSPTARARLGAFFMAEQYLMQRAWMKGGEK